MSFQSLYAVLGTVQKQYKRPEHNQLQQVMQAWATVVGPVVADQTRPLTIYRGVLKVATSSAAWSQNLVFERQHILNKLNQCVSPLLTDIRFSPGQWHNLSSVSSSFPGEQFQQELWQAHPSHLREVSIAASVLLSDKPVAKPSSKPVEYPNAITAFQHWAAQMRARSLQLPLCPECQCPAPVGELNRWTVCAVCAAKRWS